MKKNIYIILIAFLTGFCFFILAGSINKPFGKKFILNDGRDGYFGGDLYAFSKVREFKEHIKMRAYREYDSLESADIIVMGDSFFNLGYDSDIFANELQVLCKKKIFNVRRSVMEPLGDSPLLYLKKTGYKKAGKKILILESAERYTLVRADHYMDSIPYVADEHSKKNAASPTLIADIEYFFLNNKYCEPVDAFIKDMQFHFLGEISNKIPLWSENPPMLFYDEEVAFNKKNKPDSVISKASNEILNLKRQLLKNYNIELLYVVIPHKYSIYGSLLGPNGAYDNYIPRLTQALNKRSVPNINIYSKFSSYATKGSESLYYKGDTHFRPVAKLMVARECNKFLRDHEI